MSSGFPARFDITVMRQEKRLDGSKLLMTSTEHLLVDSLTSSALLIDQKEKLQDRKETVKTFEHK